MKKIAKKLMEMCRITVSREIDQTEPEEKAINESVFYK